MIRGQFGNPWPWKFL